MADAAAEAPVKTTAQLEQNVENSSRRVVRSAAGIRAVGGGNLLIEPLAPYLAGDKEMRLLTKNRQKKPRTGRLAGRKKKEKEKEKKKLASSPIHRPLTTRPHHSSPPRRRRL